MKNMIIMMFFTQRLQQTLEKNRLKARLLGAGHDAGGATEAGVDTQLTRESGDARLVDGRVRHNVIGKLLNGADLLRGHAVTGEGLSVLGVAQNGLPEAGGTDASLASALHGGHANATDTELLVGVTIAVLAK